MSQKVIDFTSSFGLMLLGVILLFLGSIFFGKVPRAATPQAFILSVPSPQAPANYFYSSSTTVAGVIKPKVPLAKDNSEFSGKLTAQAVLVVDDKTSAVLYGNDYQEIRPLASISKLMSAMVLADLPVNWSSTTVIAAADVDTSSHHINPGEKFSLNDLWNIALIGSSNSAINTLVRSTGFSEKEFVNRMNKKVAELRLEPLHFVEPTGLSSANIGSAWTVSRLLKEALNNKKIYRTLQIGEYYVQPIGEKKSRRVWSTDWLLTNWIPNKFSKDNIAGKTGYIGDSGYNFVVRLQDKNNHAIRVVILGAASNEARFSEARDLAEWTFNHYLWPDQAGYDQLVK